MAHVHTSRQQLTAEQIIERAHLKLMRSQEFCFLSGIFMMGKVSVSDTVPTAATDGKNVFYGRGFIESLDEKQVAYLIAHENYHKAYRHMSTWRNLYKRDAQLANIACDAVINASIDRTDPSNKYTKRPPDGVYLDWVTADMDSYDVFKKLEQNGHGKKPGGKPGDQPGGKGGEPGEGDGEPGTGFDEHDWETAGNMTDEEAQKLQAEVDAALRQGSMLAGKRGGNVDRALLEATTPRVDWRQVLRDFMKSAAAGRNDSTWRRPNRRFLATDMYLPSSISLTVGKIVFGVDTSGSIGGEDLTAFLSEVSAACNETTPEEALLLYWDAHVASVETYKPGMYEMLMESTKPKGGGGTAPSCVPQWLKDNHVRNVEAVIMLTDGYVGGDWGQSVGWPCPVLWVVVGAKDAEPAVGTKVIMRGDM